MLKKIQVKCKWILILILVLTMWGNFKNPVEATGGGFWHTSGSQMLDANNQVVKMAGISWFGLETGSYAPHGLWVRNYKEMIDQIKTLGFNTIRLPFSNQALELGIIPTGIDFSKNPDLAGLSPVQIMDNVIAYAGQDGIKVLLDQHRPDSNAQSALWYAGNVTEARWISDWEMLVKRYVNNPTVIGVDLHNEPHDSACWGCADPNTDWKMAATKAGNAIQAINPQLLIMVEGVQNYQNNWYWWGGNLMGVKDFPITLNTPNQIIYSIHDYPASVGAQPWLSTGNYPNNLENIWDANWGYVQKNNIAPVVVGEFGTKLETASDKQWFDSLVNYLGKNNISWIYWSLNPNSGDTGGVLKDDWATVNLAKMDKLKLIESPQFETTLVSNPTTPTVAPSPTVTTSLSTTTMKISYAITDRWEGGFIANVTLTNTSGQPINGWSVDWKFDGNQKIINFWDGNYSQSGNLVTATNTTWNEQIMPNKSVKFGFQATASGNNLVPAINYLKTLSNQATTPILAPTVVVLVPTAVTNNQINVWWPTNGAVVSGTQPLKAVMSGLDVANYDIYWQVEGGQLNLMNDSTQNAPHKQAEIEVSGWNWNGNGPYQINFVAKDKNGQQIGQSSVSITKAY